MLISMINKEEFENNLAQFQGCEKYYKYKFFGVEFLLTEGIYYLANHGCYWFLDVIFSYQRDIEKQFPEEFEFQIWTIQKLKNGGWSIVGTDGDDFILKRQHVPFSDFPLEQFSVLLSQRVIMLKNEY